MQNRTRLPWAVIFPAPGAVPIDPLRSSEWPGYRPRRRAGRAAPRSRARIRPRGARGGRPFTARAVLRTFSGRRVCSWKQRLGLRIRIPERLVHCKLTVDHCYTPVIEDGITPKPQIGRKAPTLYPAASPEPAAEIVRAERFAPGRSGERRDPPAGLLCLARAGTPGPGKGVPACPGTARRRSASEFETGLIPRLAAGRRGPRCRCRPSSRSRWCRHAR